MNPIYSVMYFKVSNSQLYILLLIIWGIGIAIFAIVYYISIVRLNQRIHILTLYSKKLICKNIETVYPIYISKYVQTPTVFTTKKIIFLPMTSYTESELNSILSHEMGHIKNHDGLIKQMINILVVLYWWNPFVYLFRKQLHLLLEMRADYNCTKHLDNTNKYQYVQNLIRIQKKACVKIANSSFASYMIDENIQILKYRINYLMEEKYQQKTNRLFLVILIFLPFLTNSIILEAAFPAPNENELLTEDELKNGYITLENNGDYKFHLGEFEAIIENPNSKEFKDLPILTGGKEE